MIPLKQMAAVTAVALETLPRRWGSSLIVVIGTGTTVAVLISALAIASGFARSSTMSGSANRVIVLAGLNEASSAISPPNVTTIVDAPGVAHTKSGTPIASADVLTSIPLTDARTGRDAYITVRGVGEQMFLLHPEIRIRNGRTFVPGRREVIVGQALALRMAQLAPGSSITFPSGEWNIVGIFDSGGGSHETEILSDSTSIVNDFHLTAVNSVTVRLDSSSAYSQFSAAIASNPSLMAKAQREDEYYSAIARPISRLLAVTAYSLGAIMAFGAVFGGLNTMFAAVRARRNEIATFRAIGFSATSVIGSVIVEAMLLGLVGALLGALLVWTLLDGARVSTMIAPGALLHITFGLNVDSTSICVGIIFALGISCAYGVFAARQAARIPIAAGMREG